MIGRVETVDRHGFSRNRILELERAIEIDVLVMSVSTHSVASLEHVRVQVEKRPSPLCGTACLLLGSLTS